MAGMRRCNFTSRLCEDPDTELLDFSVVSTSCLQSAKSMFSKFQGQMITVKRVEETRQWQPVLVYGQESRHSWLMSMPLLRHLEEQRRLIGFAGRSSWGTRLKYSSGLTNILQGTCFHQRGTFDSASAHTNSRLPEAGSPSLWTHSHFVIGAQMQVLPNILKSPVRLDSNFKSRGGSCIAERRCSGCTACGGGTTATRQCFRASSSICPTSTGRTNAGSNSFRVSSPGASHVRPVSEWSTRSETGRKVFVSLNDARCPRTSSSPSLSIDQGGDAWDKCVNPQ